MRCPKRLSAKATIFWMPFRLTIDFNFRVRWNSELYRLPI
jgi:hypothetical protein